MIDHDPVLAELEQQTQELKQRAQTLSEERKQAEKAWFGTVHQKLDSFERAMDLMSEHLEVSSLNNPAREQELEAKWETWETNNEAIKDRINAANDAFEAKQAEVDAVTQRLNQVEATLRQHVIDTYGEEHWPPAHRRS